MFKLIARDRTSNRCPLCMADLESPEPFQCKGCDTTYHPACARELGGCGTLGCSMAGVGPDGPVSLASLQRHIDRVGGRATAMSGAAVSERAKLIREVLLAERAKLLEERRIRERYETSKRRRHQLELLVTLACLALMLYGLAVRVF